MSAWKARLGFSLIFAIFGSLVSLLVLYILGVLLVTLFLLSDKIVYVLSNYTKSFLALINLDIFSGVLGALFVSVFLVVLIISIIYGYRLGGKVFTQKVYKNSEQNIILSSAVFLTLTFLVLGFGFISTTVLSKETECGKVSDKSVIFSSRILKIADFTVDIENDGFDDYLNLIFLVNATCDGDYKIQANLYDKEGELIKRIYENKYLKEGEGQIQAIISGEQLKSVVTEGNIILKDIILKGQYLNTEFGSIGELVIEKWEQYVLESYAAPETRTGWINFESVRDYGVDADGNGLFEELIVELEAHVLSEGTYQAKIIFKRGINSKSQILDLKRGKQKIEFIISGTDIFDKRVDGPYNVKDVIFQLEEFSKVAILDESSNSMLESYVTREYDYRQFE